MDPITHGLYGAVTAQTGFTRRLGTLRAMAWGAVICMLPDLDVFVRLSPDPFAEMLYHRGLTHALWFGPLFGPLGAFLTWRYYRRKGYKDSYMAWCGLWIWGLVAHPLLDVFTVYGTQLLAPFCTHRFSFNALPIIDFFYTGILLCAVIAGVLLRRRHGWVFAFGLAALTGGGCYTLYGLAQNERAQEYVRDREGLPQVQAFTTLFHIFGRRVVIDEPGQVRIGHLSMRNPQPVSWQTFPKAAVSDRLRCLRGYKIFREFTQGWILPFDNGDTQELYDLRYGFPDAMRMKGIWGIRITGDGECERFHMPAPEISLAAILAVWNRDWDGREAAVKIPMRES